MKKNRDLVKGVLLSIRSLIVSACIAGVGVILLLFLLTTKVQGEESSVRIELDAVTSRAITPTVVALSPSKVPNNLDTTIIITGTDFQAMLTGTLVLTGPMVSLNNLVLPIVGWVNSTMLTATVPWGLDAGVYTVTVSNPEGGTGSLPNAFVVEQTIGVWTTGGPYGGHVEQVVVHPQISTTVYAVASQVGLFRSIDGGESWEHIQASTDPIASVALQPDALQNVLSGDSEGLYRSSDGGDTWQELLTGNISAIAYAPSAPSRIYIGIDGTVQVIDNDGQPWQPTGTGLPGVRIRSIAIHPTTYTIAYVGTDDGRIYKTSNGGEVWQGLDTSELPDEAVRRLRIDPFNSERIYAVGWDGGELFHRSLDSGTTWERMVYESPAASDLALHPTISGTMYSATMLGVYSSTNAGESWNKMSELRVDNMWSIALDPIAGDPLYCGGGTRGVFRSDDGGLTWQIAARGMSALQPWALAVAATVPQQVYVGAETAGGFSSQNAGQSWQTFGMPEFVQIVAAAADPMQPCVGYFGGMGPGDIPNSSVGYIRKTTDCGTNWITASLPTGPSGFETVSALAVDPHNSNTIFAGGIRSWPGGDLQVGMVYSSTNGGMMWQEIDIGHPISDVSAITFDSLMTGTIYIATGGNFGVQPAPIGIVYKSIDDGTHWEVKSDGLSELPITAMVADPSNSDTLYVGVYENPEPPGSPTSAGGIFKSIDGGNHWQHASVGLEFHDITSLVIDPLALNTLYAGTQWHGLYQTINGGATWSKASGPLGIAGIFCLATGATAERTFVYVGTAGGVSSSGTLMLSGASARANEILGAGVYQQTIIHRFSIEKVYLPLVLRNS